VKLSFIPINYEESLTCDGISAVPKNVLEDLVTDFKMEDPNLIIKEANYGGGADWIWILVIFSAVVAVIERGEKISKGIDGWINIGKKLKKLKKKTKFIKLDRDALLAIAILKVQSLENNIESLHLISDTEIDIKNNSGLFIDKPATDFTSKEDSFTMFVLKVNERNCYIIGCTIEGEIEILKTIELKNIG